MTSSAILVNSGINERNFWLGNNTYRSRITGRSDLYVSRVIVKEEPGFDDASAILYGNTELPGAERRSGFDPIVNRAFNIGERGNESSFVIIENSEVYRDDVFTQGGVSPNSLMQNNNGLGVAVDNDFGR